MKMVGQIEYKRMGKSVQLPNVLSAYHRARRGQTTVVLRGMHAYRLSAVRSLRNTKVRTE